MTFTIIVAVGAAVLFVYYAIELHKRNQNRLNSIVEEKHEADVRSRVNDLTYGDISDDFAKAIDPDKPNETFTDTYINPDEKAPFSPNGVFAVPNIDRALEQRKANNG